MKTFFVITFGTSDVQFENAAIENFDFELSIKKVKGFESISVKPKKGKKFIINLRRNRNHDSYLLASPRKDGQTVLNNFNALAPIISLPLTLPTIQKIIDEGDQIHNFILVYTDQQDANEGHRSNDSLHIASIFRKKVQQLFSFLEDGVFSCVPITEKVTDIDHQYVMLSKTCRNILQTPDDQIEKIILLAQGGIDQINQALTLQLIQAFGNKLVIYQQAEDTAPHPLHFTHLFIQDFIKHQVAALVNSADYHAARTMLDLINNKNFNQINIFLSFAEYRKMFLYKEAEKIAFNSGRLKTDFMVDYCARNYLPEYLNNEFSDKELLFLVAERFYIADFYFSRKKYTDYVLAFQIFYETLCNLYLSDVYQVDLTRKHHDTLTNLLDELMQNEADVYNAALARLQTSNGSLLVSFPTIAALSMAIAEKKTHDAVRKTLDPLLHINSQLNGYSGSCGLDILRNNIAHGGKGVLEGDLYFASNIKNKSDKLYYWRSMMNELRNDFIKGKNPYDVMNALITENLYTLY